MPSLKTIRTRIASVKSTQKITRAMKLVSAARLRRAQDAIVGARPYANALAEAVVEVALRAGADAHPLLDRRTPERLTMVPLTSDRGLAGGFNANVFRAVQRFIDEQQRATPPAREIALEIVGKKGRDYFRRRKMTIGHELPGPTAETAVQIAREMAHIVTHSFHERAHRRRLPRLQRVQVGGAAAGGRRAAAADHAARACASRPRPAPRARSTSSTSRRSSACWTRCCRCTSSRRSTAACSSRWRRSSARA